MITKPKGAIIRYLIAIWGGNNPERICEPSSGGMGMRLKTASKRLIRVLKRKITNTEILNSPIGK